MRPTILIVSALFLAGRLSAQSFTFCPSDDSGRTFRIVSYDADFLFASRHSGSAKDEGGNREPGFFVHSKSAGRWLRILTVTTRDGRFGRYSAFPREDPRLPIVAITWDFRHLASQPFAKLPLETAGWNAMPDSIAYEPGTGRYALVFMSSWRDFPDVMTTLYIRRADLVDAFAQPPWPRPGGC